MNLGDSEIPVLSDMASSEQHALSGWHCSASLWKRLFLGFGISIVC